MSSLVKDVNSQPVQAFRFPVAGQTTNIATVSAGSAPSGALVAGVYRIISAVDISVAQGAVAAATDMPLRANVAEYFYVNSGENISVWDAGAGSAVVALTRMP